MTALANYDLDDGLRRLTQPALILLGEHFHYAKFASEMIKRSRDVRAEVLAGARFCISWERAGEIAEKAGPFLLGAA